MLGGALFDVLFGNDLFLPRAREEICLAVRALGVKQCDGLVSNHFRNRFINILSGADGRLAEGSKMCIVMLVPRSPKLRRLNTMTRLQQTHSDVSCLPMDWVPSMRRYADANLVQVENVHADTENCPDFIGHALHMFVIHELRIDIGQKFAVFFEPLA